MRLPKSSRISGEPSDVGFGAQHFEVQPGALTAHPQSIVPQNAQLRINFPKVIAEASNSTTFGGTVLTTELNQTMRRLNQSQRPSLQEPGATDLPQNQASMIKYTHLQPRDHAANPLNKYMVDRERSHELNQLRSRAGSKERVKTRMIDDKQEARPKQSEERPNRKHTKSEAPSASDN